MDVAHERDRLAVNRLLAFFHPKSGRWSTPTGEAWQPALAVDAVITTYERTRDVTYLNVIEKSFARYRGRRSHYYDDDGWYLNAWLRAYDVTGDPKYLDEARALFTKMTQAWDDVCGGGLWWNADRGYKNAITNELFLLAAARLHRRARPPAGEGGYLDWALREWNWFDASGMINSSHQVNDGLDGSCANNGGVTWTYNQGVILGGLVELWRITGDRGHLARARQIADATVNTQVHPGLILREPGEPATCSGDALIFKGVFVQGLARLYNAVRKGGADRDSGSAYWTFLNTNADAVWRARQRIRRGVGPCWTRRGGRVNAATQASASLLVGGVALLHAGGETNDPPPTGGTVYAPSRSPDGRHVGFTVDAPSARDYILTFRYSAGAGDAVRHLGVNGVRRAEKLLFTDTGDWASYTTVSYTVPLSRGPNAVSLGYDRRGGSRNKLNLDSLLVR
ncbi:MAG TPA: glycoside hydrolase family 76 protein [Planosporangium sp.]|nr:glycoside hydrolase family 76 protein [Planosporangium sp.]